MAKYAEILVPYMLAEVEFYVRETSADHSVRPSDVADVYPRSENDPTDDFGDQSRFGLILDLEGAGGHHLQCSPGASSTDVNVVCKRRWSPTLTGLTNRTLLEP